MKCRLQQSALGNKHYLVKKLKFMGGNGCFEALSDKIEVDDVKEVPRHESP